MALNFQPNLSILEAPQKRLWGELANVPSSFVLCGGTAVALRLGHRFSIDFDFFGSKTFDPDELYETISFLDQSKIIRKSANTLTCVVDRDGPVQVSFFGVPKIKWIQSPSIVSENDLQIVSLLDMAGMKAAVVQKRAEAKDYIDIDALIDRGEISLPQALSAGKLLYGSLFHPQNTLKALAYYEDGNLKTLPTEVKDRLAAAVQKVDLDRLPQLDAEQNSPEQDPGIDR